MRLGIYTMVALLLGLAIGYTDIGVARADILEVRVPAYLYKEPNKRSDRVYAVSMKGRAGPFLLTLLEDRKVNGYYLVRVPGKHNESGWIYKSYVRRFERSHPDYVPYARRQYRHWIDEDHDCQDARQEALIRDSKSGVLYEDARECRVSSGQWSDPYTGRTFDNPKLLDIDHFVPLKNAHESGAWAWSTEKKQRYANYLANDYHLLAVSASENRKKADKGPDIYMPPNQAYRCNYVNTWVRVKEEWELEMTEAESRAVESVLAGCR